MKAVSELWEGIRDGIQDGFDEGPDTLPEITPPNQAARQDIMERIINS